MANKTQCPACKTVHLISYEQYKLSNGKVRCGQCKHRFIFEFLESAEDEISPTTTANELKSENDPFTLDQTPPHNRLLRVISNILLLILICTFSILLAYQLWLRQQIDWQGWHFFDSHFLRASSELNIDVPVKKDLVNLNLLLATIEPHFDKPSTMLARVKLLNQSTIAQPFPWLELVLKDQDGHLVARKAMDPTDYLHNNQTENSLQSNELKSIRIELAHFPENVYGYELRLLNK